MNKLKEKLIEILKKELEFQISDTEEIFYTRFTLNFTTKRKKDHTRIEIYYVHDTYKEEGEIFVTDNGLFHNQLSKKELNSNILSSVKNYAKNLKSDNVIFICKEIVNIYEFAFMTKLEHLKEAINMYLNTYDYFNSLLEEYRCK